MKKVLVAALIFFITLTIAPVRVFAESTVDSACPIDQVAGLCQTREKSLTDYVKEIVNVVSCTVGALSVIMIIFTKITNKTLTDDPKKVEKSKKTIKYSVIGMVVAVLAFVTVNFIMDLFK